MPYEINTDPNGFEASVPSLVMTAIAWVIASVNWSAGLELTRDILTIVSLIIAILVGLRNLLKRTKDNNQDKSGG